MNVTMEIMGCGGSAGVPMASGEWGRCNPKNPKNTRLRSAVAFYYEGVERKQAILVDTGPDFRQQILTAGIRDIAAVIITHAHTDHLAGLDDLRPFYFETHQPIPVIAFPEVLENIRLRYPYLFGGGRKGYYDAAFLEAIEVEPEMQWHGMKFRFFEQDHGACRSLGLRLGNTAYSTDVLRLNDYAFAQLQGIEQWVVSAVRREPHVAHAHLAQVVEWINGLGVSAAYLTHMNHSMDYDELLQELPPHIRPAHDGLKLVIAD